MLYTIKTQARTNIGGFLDKYIHIAHYARRSLNHIRLARGGQVPLLALPRPRAIYTNFTYHS